MSTDSVEFANPDNLPVENVTLAVTNAGVVQQVKALDPYWVEKRELSYYERPPSGNTHVFGAMDRWKVKIEEYMEDLRWLLRLEHHRFWSTVLYHPQCIDVLVSFLQEANPPYVPPYENRDVHKAYAELRRLILVIFSRLITNKESKSQWMTKDYLAEVIYSKFIFTIPIIWDICLVYGMDNGNHVSRMLCSVFALQPQYQQDAAAAVTFVNEAFKYIILQVNKDYNSEHPPNLPESFKGFAEIHRPSNSRSAEKLTFSVLKDLVVHLLDTAMTLRLFIETYSGAVKIYKETNFVNSIVQIYEYGIPQLYEKLEELGDQTSIQYTEVEGYIEFARAELIDIFKEMLAWYKNAIFSGQGNIPDLVEEYLAVVMDGLSEKLFIKDYQACYPIQEDLELLRQAYPEIDSVKTDFILQAIYSTLDDTVPEHLLHDHGLTNGYTSSDSTNHEPAPSNSDESQPTIDIPDKVKEESLITEVKDILPYLGDGFVLKCLQHYGFDSQTVISSILEDSLAESLRGIDQSLPIIPDDVVDQKFLETGIQRLNVFDGDEFDIMTRDDVDVSRIHIGKRKSKYKDLNDMLDDKTTVKTRSDIYSKYNLVCDEEDAMYSDEYDDSYDSELRIRRGGDNTEEEFVTPRVLREAAPQESEDESEEEDNRPEEAASSSKNRMDFCVNPEEMRARREANMQARRGKGHNRPAPAKVPDVTGKPRGQGQEKEVVVGRDKKEKHKSSRANHNRRQGAQWKRSQGMMPS